MGTLSLRDLATSRWGASTVYSTHKVYDSSGPKSAFRLILRTDFALYDFYRACFSHDPRPFVREMPDPTGFKLAILFRCPLATDMLEVARKIQRHAASGFFAGRDLNWQCILSTANCATEVLVRLVFPDIVLQSSAALVSFQTTLMDPNMEFASQEALRHGLVPNGMIHWQDRQGVRGADDSIVFRAQVCLRSDGEVDADWLTTVTRDCATEAVETNIVCIPTSERIRSVLSRATYGHRLIREWAAKQGILNKKGGVATNSAMRIGDCYGFTLCVSSLEEQMELYKRLHGVLSKDCYFAMTERAVGVYAYFLDLDVKVEAPVDDWEECTATYVKAAIETMCEIYGCGALPRSVASASDTVALPTGERVRISQARGLAGKRGVHLVFGNILVDKQTALALRREVVARLALRSELQAYPVDLDKVVDESVYKSSSGLRILGAVKTAKKTAGEPQL